MLSFSCIACVCWKFPFFHAAFISAYYFIYEGVLLALSICLGNISFRMEFYAVNLTFGDNNTLVFGILDFQLNAFVSEYFLKYCWILKWFLCFFRLISSWPWKGKKKVKESRGAGGLLSTLKSRIRSRKSFMSLRV